jgi:hypothetical protein
MSAEPRLRATGLRVQTFNNMSVSLSFWQDIYFYVRHAQCFDKIKIEQNQHQHM